MVGTAFKNGFACSKGIIILVLCILLVALIYFAIFAPFVSVFFYPKNGVHEGISFYNDDAYLTFEHGGVFYEMLTEFDAIGKGQVLKFYHTDNYWGDNPFYGKMPDVFALDIKIDEDRYTLQQVIDEANVEYYGEIDDYLLYVPDFEDSSGAYRKVLAVCASMDIVRYILITDYESISGIDTILYSRTSLNWYFE